MRFADSFHKRLYRISKFNSRSLKTKDGRRYEVCSVKLPTYLIHSVEFEDRFGYYIENMKSSVTVLRKMVQKEPISFSEDLKLDGALWYDEFKTLEKKLELKLKEVDEHESKLLDLASVISKQLS